PGGEPWPPGGVAVDESDAGADAAQVADSTVAEVSEVSPPAVSGKAEGEAASPAVRAPIATAEPAHTEPADAAPASVGGSTQSSVAPSPGQAAALRRGLPRVPGGEPWPPAGPVVSGAEHTSSPSASTSPSASASLPDERRETAPVATPAAEAAAVVGSRDDVTPAASTVVATGPAMSVRRGLPRVAGGEPWPPADTVPVSGAASAEASGAAAIAAPPAGTEAPASEAPAATAPAPAASASTAVAPARTAPALGDPSIPLPSPRTVWNGSAPRRITATASAASARPRPTWTQAIAGLLGAAALGILAGAAVAFVRTLLSFPFMQDFLAAFPGEYAPAVAVEPGFAPWVNWAHFFNVFLMVLIIRSGLRIRNEKRPTAFWTPRGDPKGKVSLTIWFHQALDVLWLVNGVIFVVLLFVTGHWARIVPTSWEVLPNALSAALQYISFDWPTEHGWVNYNSLQQLAYFVTVFIAAPLAAATGFRMSGMWPKKAERLSKAYPIEWARALHFPIMIYFVVFIIGHVALVFLTGFLRNLNHMYASSDAVGWTGFWVFVASLVVIAVGWVAARPLVIAPIAKLFGSVSGR
ncbi:cytochrome b/b6 domain-containing protein, partial [Microbacterium sp. ISL-103]|uniref:cytochrome b/b6 domain-containing protein n=1 Tax=Microbacterium sp. ISL-103 TaxID=2819156 RepID=UPI001BEAF777